MIIDLKRINHGTAYKFISYSTIVFSTLTTLIIKYDARFSLSINPHKLGVIDGLCITATVLRANGHTFVGSHLRYK